MRDGLKLGATAGVTATLYNGPVALVRALYKEGGLKSIFHGSGATLARDGPGSAAYIRSLYPHSLPPNPSSSPPPDMSSFFFSFTF